MCGIGGFWALSAQSEGAFRDAAMAMVQVLHHRGPDDGGVWVDQSAGVAFGHRRLAILDLSPAGHQPMESASGRYVITYNGEVYNHQELRNALATEGAAPAWRGHSDTETLLAAVEHWGLEGTLQRSRGMFAVGLWDRRERTLTLARDRFGEKPLYYGWSSSTAGATFVFGSELKALRAFPGFHAEICREALTQYLRFLYVPAPRSIYQGVYKLEPGCLLTIRSAPPANAPEQPLRPGADHGTLSIRRWWSLHDVVDSAPRWSFADEGDVVRQLEERLDEAIGLQSMADVPVGAFLSGGVDSSTIAALMQRQSSRRIQTFTIGFDEPGFDEAPYAREVARHLGTEHHELPVTAGQSRDVIASLPQMYDEPFADSSQIPTQLVCRAARTRVTVALSGDAGDELFGGYNRYFQAPRIWKELSRLPFAIRRATGAAILAVPTGAWNAAARASPARWNRAGEERVGEKLHKLAARLGVARDFEGFYRSLVSEWQRPTDLLVPFRGADITEPASLLDDPMPSFSQDDELQRMMYRDAGSYLPDDILCKVDRAAMSVSLETRVPFLDPRVVEFAWSLPPEFKVRQNQGKWALRQVLYRHVPRELIERPKAGFAVPIGTWLRGPLRDWAESQLARGRLDAEGHFRSGPIRKMWSEHLSGRRDHTASLWGILMFQAWVEAGA